MFPGCSEEPETDGQGGIVFMDGGGGGAGCAGGAGGMSAVCVPACGPGQTCCEVGATGTASCSDLQSDDGNCGVCGRVCGDSACVNGECMIGSGGAGAEGGSGGSGAGGAGAEGGSGGSGAGGAGGEGGGIEFIPMDGGRFQMGGNGEYDGRPIHEVTVPPFEISRTEVTMAQYRVCLDAEVCSRPSSRGWSTEPGEREDHPVIYLDWNQAKTFAAFVGARLPTEAEWEYAARNGGQDVNYPWGNDPPTCDANLLNFRSCVGGTVPVCSFPNGNTAQGLCDMLGNVWEWVEDDFQRSYDGAPNDGTARINNPRASERITRGGGYGQNALYMGVAVRGVKRADWRGRYIGFRVARSGP